MRFSLTKFREKRPRSRTARCPAAGDHHAALTDRDPFGGHLGQEPRQLVVLDQPLAEGRVAAPADARGGYDRAVRLGGVEDARGGVLRLDQAPVPMVRGGAVAPHLLDIDVVAEAIDRPSRPTLRLVDADRTIAASRGGFPGPG
jgi:hypothetical protein